jgi:hypothetical protein
MTTLIDIHAHVFPDDVADAYIANYSGHNGLAAVCRPTVDALQERYRAAGFELRHLAATHPAWWIPGGVAGSWPAAQNCAGNRKRRSVLVRVTAAISSRACPLISAIADAVCTTYAGSLRLPQGGE